VTGGHVRAEEPAQNRRGGAVEIYEIRHGLHVRVDDPAHLSGSGVIHQLIHLYAQLFHLVVEPLSAGGIGEILVHHRDRHVVFLPEFLRRGFQLLSGAGHQHQIKTVLCKLFGVGPAQPAGGACHQRRLSEAADHSVLVFFGLFLRRAHGRTQPADGQYGLYQSFFHGCSFLKFIYKLVELRLVVADDVYQVVAAVMEILFPFQRALHILGVLHEARQYAVPPAFSGIAVISRQQQLFSAVAQED